MTAPDDICPHCGTPVGGAVGHTLCATEAANGRANLAEAAPELFAASVHALAFVRHTLEFFEWSAFPHLRAQVEQLRDRLESAVAKATPEES